MSFADPTQCPSCRAPLTNETGCDSCGFDLTSVEARQLWQTLLAADDLLERARSVGSAPTAPKRAAQAEPLPPAPPLPPPARKNTTLSTGGVILALGAACLLIAGFIFITVSWGSLGVAGRALVLLAFTGAIGVLAVLVSRRGLRGSAEALWTVFLGMVTLDWFAAWGQDLFGLREASFVDIALSWSVVIFAVAALIVHRVAGGRKLVAPQLIAGGAPWLGATTVGIKLGEEWSPFWAIAAAATIAAVFLSVAIVRQLTWTSWVVGAYAVVTAGLAVGQSIAEVVEHPTWSALVEGRHGVPMAAVVALACLAAIVVPRARTLATAAALAGVVFVVAVLLEERFTNRGALLVVAAAAIVGATVIHVGAAARGVRLISIAASLVAVALSAPWVAAMLEGISARWLDAGTLKLLAEQHVGAAQNRWWWAPLVAGVALASVALLARRWPEAQRWATLGHPAAAACAAAGVLLAASAFDGPYILLALVAVAVGLTLTWPSLHLAVRFAGLAVIGIGATLALPTQSGTAVVWVVSAVAFVTVSVVGRQVWERRAAAFGATAAWAGVAAQIVDLTRWDTDGVALTLVVAGSAAMVVACVALRAWPGRTGVEAGGLVISLGGIVVALFGSSLDWLALMCTIAGATLVVLGLLVSDRRPWRWMGSGALGVAYVVRLAASDVEVVEAYTAPFAVGLLAVGAWTLLRDDGPRSAVAVGPGLTLALLPSLPQALADPTSLRALLLGLVGLGVLGAGAWQRWKAPFLAGSVAVAMLALANLGPYAVALPRWVLIAGAGALLLGVGITWEDRVRDGRAATRYVGDMR